MRTEVTVTSAMLQRQRVGSLHRYSIQKKVRRRGGRAVERTGREERGERAEGKEKSAFQLHESNCFLSQVQVNETN